VLQSEDAIARQRVADQEALVGAIRVSSIYPSWAKLGDPSFELLVFGSNFTMTTKILFAGQEEPITFYSSEKIGTGINMPLWQGPAHIVVSAREIAVGQEADAVGECVFEFKS